MVSQSTSFLTVSWFSAPLYYFRSLNSHTLWLHLYLYILYKIFIHLSATFEMFLCLDLLLKKTRFSMCNNRTLKFSRVSYTAKQQWLRLSLSMYLCVWKMLIVSMQMRLSNTHSLNMLYALFVFKNQKCVWLRLYVCECVCVSVCVCVHSGSRHTQFRMYTQKGHCVPYATHTHTHANSQTHTHTQNVCRKKNYGL